MASCSPRFRSSLTRALATAAAVALLPPARAAEGGPGVAAPSASGVEQSVVTVFATVRYPDVFKPWTKQAPREVAGSGVIIEGKRILTNAHVVLYASQVQVQANQSGNKITAAVEVAAPGIDLAVLKLEDESFFDGRPPLPRASALPDVKDPVMAYGFPTGGSSLSITKGIVSRIEFEPYRHSVSGLRIQIDAAINPGNSGGPAMAGDKMIGVAFSYLGKAQNIGYIIPNEEIELFLEDVADGRYDGKPAMFDALQTLENPALRRFLKLDASVEGIVVNEPFGRDASYPLKRWDVITRIGDTPVDNQGKIKLGTNHRVSFRYLVQKLARDGKVRLTVVRGGKALAIDLPVGADRPLVIPSLRGAYPSYFVYGPLAFSAATEELVGGVLGAVASSPVAFAGVRPLLSRLGDQPAFPGEEMVVVPGPFFPHKLVVGYGSAGGRAVKSVNGIAVRNLRHLVEILRDARGEMVTIDFLGQGQETLVLPHKEMLAATEDVLADNGIRSRGSPDTLAAWESGPRR
jgi:S1-C subfamily serine protease